MSSRPSRSRSSHSPYPTSRPERNAQRQATGGRVPAAHMRRLATVTPEELEFLAQEDSKALSRCQDNSYRLHHTFRLSMEQILAMANNIPGTTMNKTFIPEEGVVSYVRRCNDNLPHDPRTAQDLVKSLALSWSIVAVITEWLPMLPYQDSSRFLRRCTALQDQEVLEANQADIQSFPEPEQPSFPVPSVSGIKVPDGKFDALARPLELIGVVFSMKADDKVMYFKVTGFEELPNGKTQFKIWYDSVPGAVEAPAKELQLILFDKDLLYYPKRQ